MTDHLKGAGNPLLPMGGGTYQDSLSYFTLNDADYRVRPPAVEDTFFRSTIVVMP